MGVPSHVLLLASASSPTRSWMVHGSPLRRSSGKARNIPYGNQNVAIGGSDMLRDELTPVVSMVHEADRRGPDDVHCGDIAVSRSDGRLRIMINTHEVNLARATPAGIPCV